MQAEAEGERETAFHYSTTVRLLLRAAADTAVKFNDVPMAALEQATARLDRDIRVRFRRSHAS
jgi:hypothetical protein